MGPSLQQDQCRQQALRRFGREEAGLRCAAQAFFRGLRYVRPGDNQELYAALNNNLGVALLLHGLLRDDRELLKAGRKRIRLALLSGRLAPQARGAFSASATAGRNLARLQAKAGIKKKRNAAGRKKARKR